MTGKEKRKIIDEQEELVILMNGFDDAIIGIVTGFGSERRVCYDYHKVIDILVKRDGMTEEEAVEFHEYNQLGAYVGEQTPVYIELIEENK